MASKPETFSLRTLASSRRRGPSGGGVPTPTISSIDSSTPSTRPPAIIHTTPVVTRTALTTQLAQLLQLVQKASSLNSSDEFLATLLSIGQTVDDIKRVAERDRNKFGLKVNRVPASKVMTEEGIPEASLNLIFEYLTVTDLVRAEIVCRCWNQLLVSIVSDPAWKIAYKKSGWSMSGIDTKSSVPWRSHVHTELHSIIDRNWAKGKITEKILMHNSEIRALHFSIGHTLVTGGNDSLVKIFNMKEMAWKQTYGGHTDEVSTVKLLKNSKLIVSGSHDNDLRIWDVESGSGHRILKGHKGFVVDVATLENNRVLSASHDSTLKLWDVETGVCIQTLKGHESEIHTVKAKGGRALSCSTGVIKEWDLNSHTCTKTLSSSNAFLFTLDWSQNFLVTAGSKLGFIDLWDLNTGKLLQSLGSHTGDIWCASIEGRRLVSGGSDKLIKVWDLKDGSCVRNLKGHKSDISALQCDGSLLVSGDVNGMLRIWEFGRDRRTMSRPSFLLSLTATSLI